MGWLSNLGKIAVNNIERASDLLKNKSEMAYWLDTVRQTNEYIKSPTMDALFKNPLVDEYLNRNLKDNPEKDSFLEKRIAVAAAKYASEKLGFDREKSIETARQAADALREVRRMKLLEEDRITEKEYREEKQSGLWARCWSATKTIWKYAPGVIKEAIKTKGLQLAAKFAAMIAGGPIGGAAVAIASVAKKVWDVIPQPAKEVIKKGAKWLADKAIENLPRIAGKVAEGAKKVAKTAAKVISKGLETARNVGRKALSIGASMAKSAVNTVRSVVSSIGSAVSSAFSSVCSFIGF